MKKKLYYIYLVILMAFVAGCQDEAMFTTEDMEEEMAYVTYQLKMGDDMQSRAIGDGAQVDELKVGVFQGQQLLKIFTYKKAETENFKKVTIPLLKQETYDLVFWAQKEGNGIYTIDETNFNITVNYAQYTDISLKGTEAFEAFTLKQTDVKVGTTQTNITLTRPFAQLNVAASEEDVFQNVNKVSFTISQVYTVFNPYTGGMSGETANQVFSYSFSVEDINTKQSISIEGDNYYYLASAYMFAPETVALVGGLYMDTDLVKALNVTELPLNANTRTNIYGDMIQQEELQGWDGLTFIEPTDEDLSCKLDAEDMGLEDVQDSEILHIDTPEELAWCMKNGYPDGFKVIHICSNLNMGNWNWSDLPTEEGSARSSQSIIPNNLPEGMIIVGDSPEGTLPYTISNITVSSTGLFGDVESLTVKNLTFKSVNISVQSSDAGVLVGTLKGTSTFQNVILEECSVNTSGYAGGMVGHIIRKNETDRTETLSVSFTGCKVHKTTLQGGASGKFVGLFNGYDNQESLSFDASCSSEETTDNANSPYREGNESAWLLGTDYTDYNAWLGNEKYYRGNVNFGGNSFVPKWDGTTTVEPLLANTTYDNEVTAAANKFVVYSPFDLAGVRKKTASPAAIYLRADIDMNGQGADGRFNVPSNFTQSAYSSTDDNVFDPFSYVTTLDGYKDEENNYSIYNLSISQIEQERAAFILYASGTTSHKNINFRNCQTVAVHKEVTTDAKAYGAILVSNVDATYTMENVHAYDCKVFALQKVGTLGARISGTSTLKNNSVNNCYVENYECKISERFSSGEKTIGSWTVTVYADFYPYGEVGGMYGFIQGNSTLTGCKVNGTTIYAFGQDDKMATTSGSLLARLGIAALGYYKVPGRHVSTLIGNIRATGTVTLTDCSVDTNTKCTKRHDKHNSTYNYIGQAYIVKFVDSEGSVTVDGKKLTLADCNKNTKL